MDRDRIFTKDFIVNFFINLMYTWSFSCLLLS